MDSPHVTVSVIIVSHNSRDDLAECLPSVLDQTVPGEEYEVIVIDNASTDGTVEFVRESFPSVNLIRKDENRWYAGGNNDGFESAKGEYLVVLNPDVVVDQSWLQTLIRPFERRENIGMTTSKIIMHDDRNKLNTCGNYAHFTGLGFSRGKHESADFYDSTEEVPAISGCSFAIPRKVYEEINGFDEMFEFYYEDLDLSWRSQLAGYDILYNPNSVVYHKYHRNLPPWRFFNMERNRVLLLLKHLRRRTLLTLLPALLLTELAMVGYAALLGLPHLREKIRSWLWIVRHKEEVKHNRKQVQALRRRSDAELLRRLNTAIPFEQFGVPKAFAGGLNSLLSLIFSPVYWLITRQDQ